MDKNKLKNKIELYESVLDQHGWDFKLNYELGWDFGKYLESEIADMKKLLSEE